MFYWIYNLSTGTLVATFCAFFVLVTWVGILVIRPILRALVGRQANMNDLVGYLLGSHGVYLGVLLGLLALSSYENYSSVENSVVLEATKLSALYRDVSTYPEPHRTQLTTILRAYAQFEIDEAWPLQRKGLIPTKGSEIINEFQRELVKYEPQTRTQEIMQGEAFKQLNSLIEARRMRVNAVTTGIPLILWAVVLVGCAVQIFLFWLLEMKLLPHLILSGVISFYLGTLIALVAAMDNPFRGEVSISPESFQLVLDTVMKAGTASAKADAAAAAAGAKAGGAEAPPPTAAVPAAKPSEELKKILNKTDTGVAPPEEKEEKKPAKPDAAAPKANPSETLKKALSDQPEAVKPPPAATEPAKAEPAKSPEPAKAADPAPASPPPAEPAPAAPTPKFA